MATGLFTIRQREGGPRRGYIPKNRRREQFQAQREIMLNLFADNLADGDDVARAAAKIGRTFSWGEHALRDIRRGLGWQAV